jgi:anti-sigma factor RsiW
MSHLGRRLSALIDDELDAAERDRVLVHLAKCAACREDAIALRTLKRRMSALGEAAADAALTSRLMRLAQPDGGPQEFGSVPPWPPGPGPASPAEAAREIRVPWFVAVGFGAVAVAGIGAAAFLAGAQQPRTPQVTPAVDVYMLQHDYTTGVVPATVPPPGSTGRAHRGSTGARSAGSTEQSRTLRPAPVIPGPRKLAPLHR